MLRSLIKDTAVYGLTDFIFRFLNFAIFPILAYVLTVEEFGAYSLLTTFALLMATLFNCGLNRALERFYFEDKGSAVVSMGLFCEGLFGLLFILPGLYFCPNFPFAIALLGCLPTQLFNLSLNALRLQFLPWHFTLLSLAQNGISLSLSLYFVIALKWGIAGFLSGMAIGYSLVAPVAIFLLYRRVSWVWDWRIAKEMLQFGYPFIFVDVSRWIFTSLDRWILAKFADATEVGLYSMAFKLSTVLIFMISAFSMAWTPHALKAQGQDPNHRQLFSRCFTLWFFGLTCAAMLIHLFGRECLMLLTPSTYWPAAELLPYVATGLALFGTSYVTVIGMMITKKTQHLTWVAWVAAGLSITLNLYLAPRFGAVGSAVASLMTYCVLSSYYLYSSQRLYPLPLEYGKMALTLGLLFGSALLTIFLNGMPWSYAQLLPKGGCLLLALLVGFRIVYTPGFKRAVPVN
jgi:O-antigen/teichoic acid export membrane protein